MRILKRGSRGSDVRSWQRQLAHRGYEIGPQDGIFGSLTEAATQSFQRACGLDVDGQVGPTTRACMDTVPAPEAHPVALLDALGPDTTGFWIHRLGAAIERAGGTVESLANDIQALVGEGKAVVWIKVADGRELHNQARLAEAVDAFRAVGVEVGFWSWVYAVYYNKKGIPATPYHATVEYVCDQAEVLADQCRRHSVRLACANMEGEGAWSTTSAKSAVYGPRNIRLFGSQGAADRAIAERADAYAQTLRAALPYAVLVSSTHGRPWTQRLPWREMCAGFDVLAPQLYKPGSEGWRGSVIRACARWRSLGARRIRVSGPSWRTERSGTNPRWIPQLDAVLDSGAAGPGVDRGADWWTYELATPAHRAALQKVAA